MTDDDSGAADSLVRRVPWRRIASVVGAVVLVAIVVPFVVYAVPQVVGAEHSFVVLSGSMEPTMSPGDVVIVNDVDKSKIEEGDIITFQSEGGKTTTHRVVNVVKQGERLAFRTKGDANEDPDQRLIPSEEVVGRVMSIAGHPLVIPFIGHVIWRVQTPLGLVSVLIAPLVVLAVSEIWTVVGAATGGSDASSEEGDENEREDDGTLATETAGEGDDEGDEEDEEEEENGSDGADGTEETESTGLTFSASELQLGLVVLGAFLAYSVWVAYATFEIWAFSVAGSVAASLLLLSGLYVFGGGDESESEDGASGSGTEEYGPTAEDGTSANEVESGESLPDGDVDVDSGLGFFGSDFEARRRESADRGTEELDTAVEVGDRSEARNDD